MGAPPCNNKRLHAPVYIAMRNGTVPKLRYLPPQYFYFEGKRTRA